MKLIDRFYFHLFTTVVCTYWTNYALSSKTYRHTDHINNHLEIHLIYLWSKLIKKPDLKSF